MNDIVSKMKKDKDKAMKQVKETEAALQGLITKIRVGVLMCAYGNDPKFSDRQVWENSAAVWSSSTLFASLSASFGCIALKFCLFVCVEKF